MRRYLFALGIILLGMALVAVLPEIGSASDEPAAGGFSLLILGETGAQQFCTEYDPYGYCLNGFYYPRYAVMLDKKTGGIWAQTVETVTQPISTPNGDFTKELATGKVKSCFLGLIGSNFNPHSFPVNETGYMVCPTVAPADQTPLENELPVELLSSTGIRIFCTTFRDPSAGTCLTGFPFPQNTILVDKTNGHVWIMTVETDNGRAMRVRSCAFGVSRPEFLVQSNPISGDGMYCR